MTFAASIRTCFQNYAVSAGRAGKSEYWNFVLFTLILEVVTRAVDHWGHFEVFRGARAVGIFVNLAMLLPSVAVQIRRLHDLDKSWKWGLLVLIPVVGTVALLTMSVRRGTPGDNRFGPEPADESPQENLSPA